MKTKRRKDQKFHEYYKEWVKLYKVGAIRSITLQKYYVTEQKLQELVPDLKLKELDRYSYQKLLNDYALTHEKQTTMDFHHQLKGAILDAVDEGIISQNPTRKIVIKGKAPRSKKAKFLNQFEVQALLKELNLTEEINWDWFILLVIKTGLRFSEALALTPSDFDFSKQKIIINKTWNYKKTDGSFQPTKNESSNRKIQIDWQLAMQFSQLIKLKEQDKPIFVKSRVFNSTINNRLNVLCNRANIPIITVHSLRHTHASLLLFAGVSIASVANRLGHSSMTTTQETYLHIIQELENQDNDKIIRHLSMLM
ncbi:site-specific integrase [Listeria ivanovii]|uniref:site-specific integrase n=1 Tax=Listeria ivanovii TaxID=1638 RepID=UPI0005128CE8|nr:site-specific integrase [Listeria ivanovii]AIS61628.1 integrase [Listeria ivanovii subsp. londoniensis]MBK1965942.1 site-specific integrase [Listeria ivanovii subsp. londoniensis]MBK1984363.1 site-specific integrase [Listeria ivanovii subsp. londoniensis]MBK1995425.1 site-specific integrase [Listeria ivanovii subsp. londoniensis]MBM5721907.1 site-specific integrase [Listeria ivanovii]